MKWERRKGREKGDEEELEKESREQENKREKTGTKIGTRKKRSTGGENKGKDKIANQDQNLGDKRTRVTVKK